MSESDSAKQAAVAWIHAQMERYALTYEDLVDAGCFAESAQAEASEPAAASPAPAPSAAAPAAATPAPRAPLYRNAMGQSWDGTGPYPDWLQRAVNAGQSIEFFRVE